MTNYSLYAWCSLIVFPQNFKNGALHYNKKGHPSKEHGILVMLSFLFSEDIAKLAPVSQRKSYFEVYYLAITFLRLARRTNKQKNLLSKITPPKHVKNCRTVKNLAAQQQSRFVK